MSTPPDPKRSPVPQATLFEMPDDQTRPPQPATPDLVGRLRLRTANRHQIVFRATPLDALLPQDHPARIICPIMSKGWASYAFQEFRALWSDPSSLLYHLASTLRA